MSDAKDREAALAAGFQALVTKPVDPETLVAIVGQWAAPDGAATGAPLPIATAGAGPPFLTRRIKFRTAQH